MPEPNYANGDPPGLLSLVIGTIVVLMLLFLVKSCIWGG